MQTGIGITDTVALTRRVIEANAIGLISVGTAGGLAPLLPSGTLLVPGCIWGADGAKRIVDTEWQARVTNTLRHTGRVDTGDLLTVDRVVRDPDAKASLFKQTQAVGVDMESSGLADIAAQVGLPFLSLRVVMDTAADEIPAALAFSVTESGETRVLGLLGYLAGHPSEIPALVRTVRQYRIAAASLRRACRQARNELLCPR
jgi:adenosylhomocysteine nucleosidase